MDPQSPVADWSQLSVEERIERCRQLANEAAALASAPNLGMKEAAINLVAQWNKLADELEAQRAKDANPFGSDEAISEGQMKKPARGAW